MIRSVDIIIPHAWFPIVAAHEKAEQDSIPLFGWMDEGWLVLSLPISYNRLSIFASPSVVLDINLIVFLATDCVQLG